MKRSGYLLFTVLYIGVFYAVLFNTGIKKELLVWATTYFIAPYMGLTMLMAIVSLLYWFMKPNPDMSAQALTFLHATWLGTLAAFLGYRYVLVGGVLGKMLTGL